MLEIEKCFLVVVDVQGKLAQIMHDKEALFANIQILAVSEESNELCIPLCGRCP